MSKDTHTQAPPEFVTRDLQSLVKALYAEADKCEMFNIDTPAKLLREAAAVIQPEANAQTMDMFAEVTSAGHLAEALDNLRISLHNLADEFDWIEELSGASCAATLREIAGDHKPHRKLPILPSDKAERVHAIVNEGPFPGMYEAFDAHMGAACWTDPAYAPDASMWAAAWKASAAAAEIEIEVLSARQARMNDHAVTLAETARVVEQQRIAALIAQHSSLTLDALRMLADWADANVTDPAVIGPLGYARAALAAAEAQPVASLTVEQQHLLQDCDKGLTAALAGKPDAMRHAREAAAAIVVELQPLPTPAPVSAAIWQWLTADDGGICERWQAILERWDGSDGRAGIEAAAVAAMQGHGIGGEA